MKFLLKSGLIVFALMCVAGTANAQLFKKGKKKKAEETEKMELNMNDTMTKVSYSLGMNIVANLKQQGKTDKAIANRYLDWGPIWKQGKLERLS